MFKGRNKNIWQEEEGDQVMGDCWQVGEEGGFN